MPIAPLMKKSSYLMQKFQKDIIVQVLDYFRNHIQNGNGSYLATFDFDKINFYWCKDLFYENKGEIMGAWTPMYKDSIFIKPTLYNNVLRQDFMKKDFFKKLKLKQITNQTNYMPYYTDEYNQLNDDQQMYMVTWNEYCMNKASYNNQRVRIGLGCSKLFVKDFEKYFAINSLFTYPDTSTINVILHQLYHKYQFSASWITPILYIVNFFVSQFFGYQNASRMKWTIQGDVRNVVDNSDTHNKIMLMQSASTVKLPEFYRFLHQEKQDQDDDYKDTYIKQFKQYFVSPQFKVIFNLYKKYGALQDSFVKEIEDFCR